MNDRKELVCYYFDYLHIARMRHEVSGEVTAEASKRDILAAIEAGELYVDDGKIDRAQFRCWAQKKYPMPETQEN